MSQNVFFSDVNFWSKSDCWIKIEFKNLSFWKINFLQKMIIQKVLFSISSGTINSQFKIWHVEKLSIQSLIFKEKVCFIIWIFSSENFISNSDFQWKGLLQIMPFKISTKSEIVVVFCGANWVRTFFFQMWVFDRNLISQ